MSLMTSGVLKSSEVCTKLILKWFFNNEIKAYLGNCHVLQSTREHGNTNIEGIISQKVKVKIVTESMKLRNL